jgi:hypothetical protein
MQAFSPTQTLTVEVNAAYAGEVLGEINKINRLLERHRSEARVAITSAEKFSRPHLWMPTLPIPYMRFVVEAPMVAGQYAKMIGSFELAEDGKSVYRTVLPGYTEADLEPFRARWNECDHCGLRRDRHASFVCEQADGERLLIGRQCSLGYMGLDPARLLAEAAAVKSLLRGDAEWDPDRPSMGGATLQTEYLAQTAYRVARRYGGYTRVIRDQFLSDVDDLMNTRGEQAARTKAWYREWAEKAKPPALDLEALARYLETATGEFGDNLRIALNCAYLNPKRKMLVCAGVGLFVGNMIRREGDAERAKSLPPAKHLAAAVGKRVDFDGVVVTAAPYNGNFGPGVVVSIVADDGSRCIHFASGVTKPQAGQRYHIRGTVREHGASKRTGEPQTVLSRAIYKPCDQGSLFECA